MSSESRDQAFGVDENRIALIHADLLESRNAVYLLEVTLIGIVITLLTQPDIIKLDPTNLVPYVRVGLGALAVFIVNLKRKSLNKKVANIQKQLGSSKSTQSAQ